MWGEELQQSTEVERNKVGVNNKQCSSHEEKTYALSIKEVTAQVNLVIAIFMQQPLILFTSIAAAKLTSIAAAKRRKITVPALASSQRHLTAAVVQTVWVMTLLVPPV